MNYEEALQFFHSFDRFGVQPGLDRVYALSVSLGDPQNDLSFIHVAGTNGKGSTCTMLSQVFRAAGYTVGLYTSPYVLNFRERIQINGQMIAENELASLAQTMRDAVGKCNENGVFPTEFEVVTAAAFYFFKQKKCDIVILEVGLGGRFDATNIIEKPEVSVIASVSFDHVGILGDTLSAIAGEKAGIIKPQVPVVTSENQPEEVKKVLQSRCSECASELHFAKGTLPHVCETLNGTLVHWNNGDLHVPFAGVHMVENACLVIETALLCAEKWHITEQHIRDGIAAARIPARIEILCEKPLIVLDGSHNDGSTAALARVLQKNLPDRKILALMGMMADKEVDRALDNLLPCFDYVIAVTASNPRSLQAEELAEMIRNRGTKAVVLTDMDAAVTQSLRMLSDFDALIVCGSLYLAGDVRQKFVSLIDKIKK